MFRKIIFIFLCWIVSTGYIFSKTVSKEFLESKLDTFTQYQGMSGVQVKGIYPYTFSGVTVFYVVNFSPEGWMLISADDLAAPILAYSKTGTFEVINQPETLKSWLSDYASEIYNISSKNDSGINPLWGQLPARVVGKSSSDIVDPLIAVKFNQSSPWNKYCPSDVNGRAVVGCVAVAMAQAMTVPQYPVRPVGNFNYYCAPYGNLYIDYDNETAYDWNLIVSGTDGKDAAARFLYQCGVSVRMEYSASASGTQSSYIPNALHTYFNYPTSVKSYSRGSDTQYWEDLVKNELLHGRAVVYSGSDGVNAGHAFNLDGYDGNNMYHVNWGWGGANNGYYTINTLKDGENDFSVGQQVVVGIRAPSVGPADIYISNLKVEENKPVGTIVGTVTIDSEATNPVYKFDLKGAYSVFTHSYLPSSFYIEDGYLKTSTPFSLEDESIPLTIKATNVSNGLSYEKNFNIEIVAVGTGIEEYAVSSGNLIYYDDKIILNCDCNELPYCIYTLAGTKVMNGKLNKGINNIDKSKLNSGYFLVKTNDTTIKPIKILILK